MTMWAIKIDDITFVYKRNTREEVISCLKPHHRMEGNTIFAASAEDGAFEEHIYGELYEFPALTATCPCGYEVVLPLDEDGDYDVCGVTCPQCHRRGTGGNGRTGEVGSWATEAEIDEANEIYRAQLMDVDYNEAMRDW
jgi:hypothetical protein